MPMYLVERYVPEVGDGALDAVADRGVAGADVRWIQTILVPGDEMCLCLFEGPSLERVAEANERAGVSYERITEAVLSDARDREVVS
jgi:hypothetical protein